jgi:hypothetical protein
LQTANNLDLCFEIIFAVLQFSYILSLGRYFGFAAYLRIYGALLQCKLVSEKNINRKKNSVLELFNSQLKQQRTITRTNYRKS